jgi:hypothetical protein
MLLPRYWRVRMKVEGYIDLSTKAWDRGEVGIWYGAWSADEWRTACMTDNADPWRSLRELPHQQALGWGKLDLGPVRRFESIGPDDWVIVFLREKGAIGLAKLSAGMQSDQQHPLNTGNPEVSETFKFRKIVNSKTFRLSELPDAYRLLPAQGRGNVHEFHSMYGHVQLLASHETEESIRASLWEMPFDELIGILGASAWESVSTAYLTIEHGFVPTGLSTGYTLPVFDIVGRGVNDGAHILAQCKKHSTSQPIDPDFAEAVSTYTGSCKAFYFCFGGCHGDIPYGVEVIGRQEVLAWAETERGAMYRRFLTGK